jgi:putative membrane protein
MKRLATAALLLSASGPLAAHGGEHAPAVANQWTFDPILTVPLALTLLVYLAGFSRLWRRSAKGRSSRRREAILFGAGWLVLALALTSPLHAGGERSFTLHMIEHELIMLVATLLLATSGAGGTMLWGLPAAARVPLASLARGRSARAVWRAATGPVVATVVQALALWLWHMPPLFDRALDSFGWHVAQHASFIVTSLLFWWAMVHSRGDRSLLGISALCLFFTSLVGGALGALMALSDSPWYAPYAAMGVSGIGLDPVNDQRLAGLVMWIPGGLVHAAAALYFVYRWLGAPGRQNGLAAR